MKSLVAILYAESRFTPWKENIDLSTINSVADALYPEHDVFIVHMIKPCAELASLLRKADYVVNLCYGFQDFNQAQVADWLDSQGINHLSSTGKAQLIAQDKLGVEKLLLEKGVHCPITHSESFPVSTSQAIRKPRFGGCHRGIEIFSQEQIVEYIHKQDASEYLIQPYLVGREFSVGVIPAVNGLGYEILPPIEIVPYPNDRDVFVAGNSFGGTARIFDPILSGAEYEELKNAAVTAHILLGLEYFSRIDFRYADGIFYVLDVNAMPNMHPQKSMIPAILEQAGIPLANLMSRFINYNNQQKKNPFNCKPINSAEDALDNDLKEVLPPQE